MHILVLNSGSSSIKFELFHSQGWQALISGQVERVGSPEAQLRIHCSGAQQEEKKELGQADHRQGFAAIRDALVQAGIPRLAGIGHRVVHGGPHFAGPVLVTDTVKKTISSLARLAPLHNPSNVLGMDMAARFWPGVPQVAVFDTAFHQTMPEHAYTYGLPADLCQRHHVRRYGFHGTSHGFVSRAAAGFLGIDPAELGAIVLHLGNGASACAISRGCSVDTSMGMTPLEGLVMGTRCGDLDPALVFYLARQTGMDLEAIETMFNRQSGLKGVCGENDMRRVLKAEKEGDKDAKLALSLYCYRIRKYIGAYLAAIGPIHALIFTGGIGEHAAPVRSRVCTGLEHLGLVLDEGKNSTAGSGIADISTGAATPVLVVPTNEELEIARQVRQVLEERSEPKRKSG
jgi:acetate kinase